MTASFAYLEEAYKKRKKVWPEFYVFVFEFFQVVMVFALFLCVTQVCLYL